MKKNQRIFLTFAHPDRLFADVLVLDLQKLGVHTMDVADAGPEENDFKLLKQALLGSDLVVFIVPSQEGEGRWALAALGAAKALERNILAVLPDRARYSNSIFLRTLLDRPVLDVANMTMPFLAKQIVASIPLDYVAA